MGAVQRVMLKSKIHRATVTDCDLHYVGSVTIDRELLEAADILEHEQVHVVDIDNGARFETYTMAGPAGSGVICLNGAAARLVQRGDRVIIISYAHFDREEMEGYAPRRGPRRGAVQPHHLRRRPGRQPAHRGPRGPGRPGLAPPVLHFEPGGPRRAGWWTRRGSRG